MAGIQISIDNTMLQDLLMDMGWIRTYGSKTKMSVQISFMNEGGSGTPVPDLSIEVDDLDAGVIFYRGYRDIFCLYIGLAYGLQIVDALVDAHLKNFDVSDDLTLHWEPALLAGPGQATALPTVPGVAFALRLK